MKRVLYLLTLTLVLLLGAAVAADNTVSDDTVYDQVRIRIAQDREVGSAAVEVKVTNGVVEITGNVADEKHKQRVEKIVKKVKGVKSVENKLRIAPAA